MCCATNDVITPNDAKAKPNWKCNEFVIVSKSPLCPAPNLPPGGLCASKISFKL